MDQPSVKIQMANPEAAADPEAAAHLEAAADLEAAAHLEAAADPEAAAHLEAAADPAVQAAAKVDLALEAAQRLVDRNLNL